MTDFDPTTLLTDEEKNRSRDWIDGFVVGYLANDRLCSPSNAADFIKGFYEGRRLKRENANRTHGELPRPGLHTAV